MKRMVERVAPEIIESALKGPFPENHALVVNMPNSKKVKEWPPKIRMTRQSESRLQTRYSPTSEEFW